jgi:hypothetical protein
MSKTEKSISLSEVSCFIRGNILNPDISSDLLFDSDGLSWVLDGKNVYYINKLYIIHQTAWIDNGPDILEEGFYRYVENGKYGYQDHNLNIIIPAQWDFAYPFENGNATVCNGCKSIFKGEYSQMVGGQFFTINKIGQVIDVNK